MQDHQINHYNIIIIALIPIMLNNNYIIEHNMNMQWHMDICVTCRCVEKCCIDTFCGSTKGNWIEAYCPKLQWSYGNIPYGIFSCHQPVICSIHSISGESSVKSNDCSIDGIFKLVGNIYTGFEGINVNGTWWGKMRWSLWRCSPCLKMCLVSEDAMHVSWSNSHQRGKVINQLLLCILLFCTILNFVDVVCDVKPKSCSRSYVHFCISWILGDLSNDPWTGTANNFDCCLHWLSNHVGKCPIARPWFSWGLVGWGT